MSQKPLIINNFQQGSAESPHVGFGYFAGADLTSSPGVMKCAYLPSIVSSTTVQDLVKWIVQDPNTPTSFYALDRSGYVYQSADSGSSWSMAGGNTCTITIASPAVISLTTHGFVAGDSVVFSTSGALPTGITANTIYYVIAAGLTANAFEISTTLAGSAVNTSGSQSGTHKVHLITSTSGDGLGIFKDYLLVARNNKLDAYGPLSSSPTWTYNFQTGLTSANSFHPMVWGIDDIFYIGNKNKVYSLQEVSGSTFSATNNTTYTPNLAAVTLPNQYSIKCIAELGSNLMLGTISAGGANNSKLADIFPWDRVKATFDLRMRFHDFGIHQMVNIDNLLYFTVGQEHTLMVTNGSSTQKVRRFGANLNSLNYNSTALIFNPYPGAIIKQRNRVMTGISGIVGSVTTGAGIWSIETSDAVNDYALSGTTVEVGSLISTGAYTYMAGMINSTTKAIFRIDTTLRQPATFYSPLYQLSTTLEPRTFTRCDVVFDGPMSSGVALTLYYRYNISDIWTQLGTGTINSTTYGLVDNVTFPAGTISARNLQIRADLADSLVSNIGLRSIQFS